MELRSLFMKPLKMHLVKQQIFTDLHAFHRDLLISHLSEKAAFHGLLTA